MEIERPFESLSDNELWKAVLKRRTSPKQRNLQLELMYRLTHLRYEVEHLEELAENYRDRAEYEKKERERFEKLLFEG